jgi:hypothetical protein
MDRSGKADDPGKGEAQAFSRHRHPPILFPARIRLVFHTVKPDCDPSAYYLAEAAVCQRKLPVWYKMTVSGDDACRDFVLPWSFGFGPFRPLPPSRAGLTI